MFMLLCFHKKIFPAKVTLFANKSRQFSRKDGIFYGIQVVGFSGTILIFILVFNYSVLIRFETILIRFETIIWNR